MDGSDRPHGFDRLHSAVRYHVVHSLRWRSLRPLQESAIGPILDGESVLLVAPTAGGKTEAAVLPLLSRMLDEPWAGTSVLYVCPLKALLNDLEPRLSRLTGFLGRRAAVWHGDVGAADRRRIRREPPDVLLTTPESIEVLLTSRGGARAFFGDVRAVVVDELHAFAGDDRGWHLLAVLERVARFAGRDLQRVGLSATTGNPDSLAEWLAGSSKGPRRALVHGASDVRPPEVRVDAVESTENAATVVSRLHRGEKRLVFCDSRSRVEDLAYCLRDRQVRTWVSHSSLSLDERRQAELAFSEGRDCVIVATSTLELGIDVGDLDRVLQVDAPPRVASFLQRLGRTGRRPDSARNLLFLTTNPTGLLVALAIVRLWRAGFVEPLEPPPLPFHVVVQQIFGLVRQQGGLRRGEWREWIGRLPGIAALDPADLERLVDHLLATGFLFEDSGIVGPGPAFEKRFSGKRFLDLYAVFSSNPLFTVRHGNVEIGKVDEASFLQKRPDGTVVLLLGGRSWEVRDILWEEREAFVRPIGAKGRSLWPGEGLPLSFELCSAMRDVLVRPDPAEEDEATPDGLPPTLTRRGRLSLRDLRGQFAWLPPDDVTVLRREETRKARLWTFAGLRANAELAGRMAAADIPTSSFDNLSIALEGMPAAGAIEAAFRRPSATDGLQDPRILDGVARGLKLVECLPPELARKTARARLADPEAVEVIAGRPVILTG